MKEKLVRDFPKTPTGIVGLDEITSGGIPTGRPTLVCGSAGCGKTLIGVHFLVKGITEYNEPGVFVSFEETATDLAQNVRSLGFDIPALIDQKKLKIDNIKIEKSEIQETGEYDLEGLFIRLNYAIDSIGAKRVVLDTIEALFGGMDNESLLRSEIKRLFQWLKDKGVTTIVTGERGEKTLTRQGLEEYVSDCVIVLDLRVNEQLATRRLRIVKYRGSIHGTNEYPFLIDETGISVMPITSIKLEYNISLDILSYGHKGIDKLFKGGGYYRGSSTLITGSAGTSKTILASYFAVGSCLRKESVLYFCFEESPNQLVRNLLSVGIDFKPFIKSGILTIHSSRPSLQGLERHLLILYKLIEVHKPKTVIVDPISSLITIGNAGEVRAMLIRLMDHLKNKQINALFTALTSPQPDMDGDLTVDAVSSLADTWIKVTNQENRGERTRFLDIVKSRGMGHSTWKWNYFIDDKGIHMRKSEKKLMSQ